MSANVTEQAIVDALHQIPRERWGHVLEFIHSQRLVPESTRAEDKSPLTAAGLLASGLVGIWSDRSDIEDSREFARLLREQAQTRSRE
jgi:hypothetical protein